MTLVVRILTILVGLVALAQWVQWIISPEGAAEALGMDLLSGTGASTQIGDISAFFLCWFAMVALGQRPGESRWFYPAAMLLAAAALMRTIAFLTGHAPFATQFIVPEVVMAVILVVGARMREGETAARGSEG